MSQQLVCEVTYATVVSVLDYWDLYYKTFYGHDLRIFVLSMCVLPGKPFQPSLLFMGEARGLPYSGAPERYFTRVGPGLTGKH